MNPTSSLPRFDVLERENYIPKTPQERIIVDLLREHIQNAIATYALSIPNAQVLDVGCGRQPFRSLLESLGYHYYSLDARQNPENSVDIICEIDKSLPAELQNSAGFNFILCTEVMEHVADWDLGFRNLATLLAPNGRLLITCPHFYPLHEEPYDFWRPTPYALEYFGARYGLKILHQDRLGDNWDVLGTFLSNSYTNPAHPRFLDRLLNRIFIFCYQTLLNVAINRSFQNFFQLKGAFYLSNLVVFEK